MKVPDPIVEALKFLEAAEREMDPDRKIGYLHEGLELIELYCEECAPLSEEEATFICNVRRAHTRRLLVQLVSLKRIDIGTWIRYIALLFAKLKDDVSYVTQSEPLLKTNFDEFMALWGAELRDALRESREL